MEHTKALKLHSAIKNNKFEGTDRRQDTIGHTPECRAMRGVSGRSEVLENCTKKLFHAVGGGQQLSNIVNSLGLRIHVIVAGCLGDQWQW